MRFEVTRRGIKIVPENDQDVAFIEDTLGLNVAEDYVRLTRKNVYGTSALAYVDATGDSRNE